MLPAEATRFDPKIARRVAYIMKRQNGLMPMWAGSRFSQANNLTLRYIEVQMRTPLRVALTLLVLCSGILATAQVQKESVVVDSQAQSHPFPHFWEHMFGSGRAILLRRA